MERLSYETLQKIGYRGYLLPEGRERFLQFGEGNFLRSFVDFFIDAANSHRFRTKSIPASGVFLRPEDEGEQLTL